MARPAPLPQGEIDLNASELIVIITLSPYPCFGSPGQGLTSFPPNAAKHFDPGKVSRISTSHR